MITPRCLNCNYPLYENLKFYCFIECSRCVELYMKRGNRLYQVKKLAEITGKEYRTAKGIVEKRDFLDVGGQEVVTST